MQLHRTGEGYTYFRDRSFGEDNTVYVHQIVAIAEGADPYKVFSGGEYHVHHKLSHVGIPNLPALNYADNLELLPWQEHAEIDRHVQNIAPEVSNG